MVRGSYTCQGGHILTGHCVEKKSRQGSERSISISIKENIKENVTHIHLGTGSLRRLRKILALQWIEESTRRRTEAFLALGFRLTCFERAYECILSNVYRPLYRTCLSTCQVLLGPCYSPRRMLKVHLTVWS